MIHHYRLSEFGEKISCFTNGEKQWFTNGWDYGVDYLDLKKLPNTWVYRETYYYGTSDKNVRELDLLLLEIRLEKGRKIRAFNTNTL